MPSFVGILLTFLLATLAAPLARAHDPSIAPVDVRLEAPDRIVVECTVNLDGWLVGEPDSVQHAPRRVRVGAMEPASRAAAIEALKERLRSMVSLKVDGAPLDLTISFPLPGSGPPHEEESEAFLGWTARLDGTLPAGARSFVLRCDPALRVIHLAATVPDAKGHALRVQQILQPGQASEPISLGGDQVPTTSVAILRQYLWLVFLFGLLHGLGFAGVLTELGLPREEFVPALVAFNVGVELGQLAVIAGACLTIGWFRNRPWYRRRIVIPLSLVIALVGAYWAVERTFRAGG